jgi:hypothetical protein
MYYSFDTDSGSDNFTLDDAAEHVNTIKKLDFTGKGFFLWSLRVKSCLNLFGLGNFINKVKPPPHSPYVDSEGKLIYGLRDFQDPQYLKMNSTDNNYYVMYSNFEKRLRKFRIEKQRAAWIVFQSLDRSLHQE